MDTTKTLSTIDEALASIPQENLGNTVRASWPFSLDNIRPAIARYNAEAKDALVSAFLWCIDATHPVAKPDFAERVGSSDNTIYKLFTGKYVHPQTKETLQPSEKLIKAIQDFLALEKKRFNAGETQIVLTPTLNSIVTLCDLARESQTITFLVGPSHIGKTSALELHYTPNNNHGHTLYTRMEAASGLGGMVRAMAKSCGVSPKGNTADIIAAIKNAVTKDMIWILDELHLLAHTYRKGSFHNCMEVIREIHDAKKMGMVLCFTILDEVKAASQKELQQLWRRGVHKLILPNMPTIADLTAILEHNGLEFPAPELKVTVRYKDAKGNPQQIIDSPREVLRQVAKDEALLAITERLRYARTIAKKQGKKLDWSHFMQAHLTIAKQAAPPEAWN